MIALGTLRKYRIVSHLKILTISHLQNPLSDDIFSNSGDQDMDTFGGGVLFSLPHEL